MTTILNSRVRLAAQPCPRNRQEMRTGLHHVSEIIPLCLANLAIKAQEDSRQHENIGKEVVAS